MSQTVSDRPAAERSRPQTSAQPDPHKDLVDLCRERIARGSKSFAGAARLFAPETRASAYMLYAWCRHCDDEIDGQDLGYIALSEDAETAEHRLERLHAETAAALTGTPTAPVFQALRHVVDRHAIPHRHPLELLEGFRMDVAGHHYATLEDTLRYGYHVAGVVGVMMAMVMGVRDRETLNRASDLGIAFQLTNIARDVVPDAEADRVYLPADWLAAEGLEASTLSAPENRASVFRVTERLLDVADRYYDSAACGIGALPPRAALAIAAARSVYREIGTIVRRRGPRAWDTRAYTTRGQKIAAFARAGAATIAAKTAHGLGRPRDVPRAGLWTHPDLGQDGPPLRAPT